MLRLRTLGTAALERDEVAVGGPATQRRRLALLALLAVAADLGVTRDKLLAYLWPERDERARHLLNQTLYSLRRELGADELFLGTDPLRLNPQVITSDVGDFTSAIEAGELERAAELYAGPFLDGFHAGGSEELERWQESTRVDLVRRLADALQLLANAAHRRGDAADAARWWRRLATLDPLNATSALGLMRALADSGNRAAALQHAKIYEALVRSELEASPDSRVLALADELLETREHPATLSANRTSELARGPSPGAHPPPSQQAPAVHADPASESRRATPFRLHVSSQPPVPPAASAHGQRASRVMRRALGSLASLSSRRRRTVAVTAGVTLLAAVTWAGVRHSRHGADEPVAAERVVVFPFSVHTGSEHAYLGRALVDLLTASIDGVDRLHAISSQQASKAVPVGSETAFDPVRARVATAAMGADLFVLGDVTEANGRLRIEAALYDTRRGAADVASRASVEGAAESVFTLADSLAAQLAAGRNGRHDVRLARLAAMTTSLRALKPYLDGQRAFQAGSVTAAEESFQRAVAADSGFALGWYSLAVAAQWTLDPTTSHSAADHAVRAGHALPERERELLAAFAAYVDGHADEAEKRYRALTATSPDDVEAWRGLGEVLFHYNWASGRLAAESRPAWERVLRADPGDWGALVHLSQVAARERHWSEVDTLVQRQLGDDSTDLVQLPVRALRAFAVHDTAEENRVIAGLQRTMHLWSLLAAWSVAVDVGDLAGAERLARVPTDSGRRPEVRALAHITLAHLALARGRKAAALAELDSAQAAFPPWGAQYRGFFLALPFVPASREELVSARDALVNVAGATAARQIVTPSPWISVHESVAPQVSHYVAARLSLRLGERDEALRYADDLDRDAGSPPAQALAVDLAREVRAADIAARGQPATALSSASERGPDLPFVYPWTSPFYSRALARFERATLLASLGRHDDALRAYSVFTDNSLDDLIFAAPAHLARARLLERSGDTARAKAEYGAFLALWRGCDPELRGSLGEAEAALTRLGQVR